MTNIVLIPGSWLGAWAWRDVTPRLRAEGHDVHELTLTGFGDRAHLAQRGVDFETHVADILGHLETEELDDVVLVAHSYSGSVGTVAATRAAERIRKLVYVAGFVPESGKTLFEQLPPFVSAEIRKYVDDGLIQVAPDDVLDKFYGDHALSGDTLARLRSHATGHPVALLRADGRLRHGDLGEPRPHLRLLHR